MSEASEPNEVLISRDKVIIKTSVIGIAVNLLLAGFKAVVGILANSIAVTLDAVNNLSDVLSSVVTLIGTKLAGKQPDKEHPLGHGRIEYLSAMVVSAIVLYAGIIALVESVKKIVRPAAVDYSPSSLAVIACAVAVKLLLGRYVKSVGKKVNSGSLIASGKDALFDAGLSASVLLSAIIFLLWDVSLEAYVGLAISAFIIKSGVGMLRETLGEILGKRVDREFLGQIRETICEEECVSGVFDLILHSYGPGTYIGSVHVEVPDTMRADEIDLMQRHIAQNVLSKHGVILAAIGIYSLNTRDDEIAALRSDMTRMIMSHDGVLQIHGFYADLEKKLVNLDVIIDYARGDRTRIFSELRDELQKAYPEYELHVTMDIDI